MTAIRLLLAPALALLVSGCTGPRPEEPDHPEVDYDPRDVYLSSESWKGDILMDVRIWRELDERLSEGSTHSSGITFSGEHPSCQNDGTPLFMWDFSVAARPWKSVARELAYYCPNEHTYVYSYVLQQEGVRRWLGPFQMVMSEKE